MSYVLSVQSVTKKYGQFKAIDAVSLNIKPGERVALLGSNGAGKSSLLSLISGLRQADQGHVEVFGATPSDLSVKHKVGHLPQTLNFPENLTVKDILSLVTSQYKEGNYQKLCEQLDLVKLLGRKTYQLSGGEKRKVALVCVLLGSPDFVVLDEPTANIDVEGQKLIEQLLMEYFRQENKTLLFSSHQMNEVEILAQKIIVLNKGRVIAEGDTKSIKQQFAFKKVSFKSKKKLTFKNVESQSHKKDQYEVYAQDSDLLLKELLRQDADACEINIVEPALDEVLIHLWKGEDLCS